MTRRDLLLVALAWPVAVKASPVLLPAGANKDGKGILPYARYAPRSASKAAKADGIFAEGIWAPRGVTPTPVGPVSPPVFPSVIDGRDLSNLGDAMRFVAMKPGVRLSVSYVKKIIQADGTIARGLTVTQQDHTCVFISMEKSERDTFAHELGHVLGLDDDLYDPLNLMATGLIRTIPQSLEEVKRGKVSRLRESQLKIVRTNRNLVPEPNLAMFEQQPQLNALDLDPAFRSAWANDQAMFEELQPNSVAFALNHLSSSTNTANLTKIGLLPRPEMTALVDVPEISSVAVPEPRGALLMGGGLLVLLLALRRRKIKGGK